MMDFRTQLKADCTVHSVLSNISTARCTKCSGL